MDIGPALAFIQAGDAGGLARLLADHPALALQRTPEDVSLLMIALYHRQADCAACLRERLSALDIFEASALGDTQSVAARLEATPGLATAWSADGFTPLHLAAFFNQPQTARQLLAAGADANLAARNPMAVRPLNCAAANADVAMVQLLLEAGADPDSAQQAGITALMSAAHRGLPEMTSALLEAGADMNRQSADGKKAVDYAREAGLAEIAQLLD